MREKSYQGEPMEVAKDDEGQMYILDGHHRAAAARMTNTPVKTTVIDNIADAHTTLNTMDEVKESPAAVIYPDRIRIR